MNKYNIKFLPSGIEISVNEGTTLLEAEIQAGLTPDAPCGGQGTCGKCLVRILEGTVTGIHKACTIQIDADMKVDTSGAVHGHSILTKGIDRLLTVDPMICTETVHVEKCVIGDNRTDWDRLKDAVSDAFSVDATSIPVNLPIISDLYDVLETNKYYVNVVMCGNEIIHIRPSSMPIYLMAFDIGTTSIVGYLLDGETGEELAVSSMLNPQSQFGADVIQRSNYALEHGTDPLSNTIHEALNHLIEENCAKVNIKKEELYLVSVVGNTCMHHLFLGISPGALVHSPYNASFNEPLILNAADYNINIHRTGKLMILPNIAGFVGADTVGCLLATEFDSLEPLSIMIDIGTNGEIVMGNRERRMSCSTAAGPAFEGAKIQCGMRGAAGAIDHLSFLDTTLSYSTIGNEKPIGICGSGLMDTLAVLLEYGFIDGSGRLLTSDELTTPTQMANAHRLTTINHSKVFVLADESTTGNGMPVFISQKDIREVQLAKGAMAAGIALLAKNLNLELNQIEKVMIAGAFGNYMSPHSACVIGLIPPILEDKIIPIGNAAGEGSKIAALSKDEYYRTKLLAAHTEFLELAADPEFQDYFVDELEFPELEIFS